jgi:hypothetical protein
MFKAQFKSKSPYETWSNLGSFGSEQTAVAAALNKKRKGALMVRVLNKQGAVIYSN